MENSNYNSLTDKLIQNGIIPSSGANDKFLEKYYGIELNKDNSTSPFVVDNSNNSNNSNNTNQTPSTKRINEYDSNLINGKNNTQTKNNNKLSIKDFLVSKFFPKIYRAILIKKSLKTMSNLNINISNLSNKSIPYGENEIHYTELINYLIDANKLQTKIKNET